PQSEPIFNLYRIMTYGQQRVIQAKQQYDQAVTLYNERRFEEAFDLFNQAFDLDPLEYTYALNTGFSLYENGKYQQAITYFKMAGNSQKSIVKEKAMRHKALSLYEMGSQSESCAVFLKLMNTYPKRMYQQEFNKYCGN
ncbi:MAG: tetratricopeptide repeat protein, partial [Flavobacteriaceae bacterium]|nr:tetratricopeptide repeat protein [Flavobacteriaceae bacterium]